MTHAIRQAVSQVDGKRLKALCIAHQRETFVPLDEHDHPLINGILCMDERARELLPFLEQTLGTDKFHSAVVILLPGLWKRLPASLVRILTSFSILMIRQPVRCRPATPVW
jgi:sugar (pentulose or hexulose) kinase